MPPPVPPPPSADALNGIIIDSVEQWQPPISRYQQQQGYQEEVSPSTGIASSPKTYSTNVKSSSSFSQDSVSPPVPRSAEEDHVYSFPNKTKSSEPSPVVLTTSLGSNLSELDRLLLELNEVQHNPPSSFASDESNRSPHSTPVSSSQYTGQENGTQVGKKVPPPTKEKPKRNGGRGIEDVRPSVESLLDELESSVPSPSPATAASPVGGPASQRGTPNQQQARMSASSATRELDELMESLSEFKVHGNAGTVTPISFEPDEKQKTSTANILLVSAPVQSPISPSTSSVLLSVPNNTQFISNGTALPSRLARTPSPLELLRIDEEPSTSQLYANALSNRATASRQHLVVHPSVGVNTKLDINVPPAVMLPILESPEPHTPILRDLQKTGSEKESTESEMLSCSSNTTKNISKSTLSSGSGQQEVDKSLIADFAEMNEALEKLLSLYPEAVPEDHLETKQQILESTVVSVKKPLACLSAAEFSSLEPARDGKLLYQQKLAAKFEGENSTGLSSPNKMHEKPAEPMAQQHQKQGREMAVEQNNVNGCSEHLRPNEKRQKEKFDLPAVQIPLVERISASRQMQSVIKRTKHSMNVHPMYHEDLPRRKFGPVIFNKNVTQDRLIAELHGKLGIEKKEPKSKPVDDWLTEGLVITSKPVRKCEKGSHVVEKIIITPEPPSSKGSTPSPRPLSASPQVKECQDKKKTELLKVTLSPPLPVPSPPPLPASFLPPLPVPSPPPLPATFQPPHPKPPQVPLPMSSPSPLPSPSQPALPKPSQPPLPAPFETSLSKSSRPSLLLPSPSPASAPLYFKCPGSQSAPQWNISIDKSEKPPVLSTPHPASVLPLEYTSPPGHYPHSSSLPVVQTTAVQAELLPSLSASPRVLVSIACQTDGEIGNEDSLLVRSQAWNFLSYL
ncbi:paxillin a isoform X2 [Mobula hypostoma]